MREAPPFADLVFHALAFVPASARASVPSRAASLYWPAYVELVKAELPGEAWLALEEDAPLLSRLFEPVQVSHSMALFAELHETVDEFMATASRALVELGDGDVRSAPALAALRSLPVAPVEIFRAGMALGARGFEQLRADVLVGFGQQVRRAIDERMRPLGAIRGLPLAEVELSLTLGARGRGFGGRTIVGIAGLPGRDVDLDVSIVLAVHELTVHRAGELLRSVGRSAHWADVEAVAVALEQRYVRGTALEAAHARWLAGLDLEGLTPLDEALSSLVERGASGSEAGPS